MVVVLTGFMGVGKTSVGRKLASRLAWGFIDTDEVVEARWGLSPADLLRAGRDLDLRHAEIEALHLALLHPRVVIATGGSTLLHPGEMAHCLSRARVYHLTASPAELLSRVGEAHGRPRWGENWQHIWAQRLPTYHQAHLTVDTTGLDPTQVAHLLYQDVEQHLPRQHSRVRLRPGDLTSLGAEITQHLPQCRRVLVVSHPEVMAHHGAGVLAGLTAAGLETSTCLLPGGEATKSWDQLGLLLDHMIDLRLDRSAVVVALGGGVVGDITGLAASLCRRGLPWVQIPTTLLAQVDAGLGGKTAINHPRGKNLVGSFYQPEWVWIDPHLLRTLPPAQWRSGWGEVLKYGAVADPSLWDDLESLSPSRHPEEETLTSLIRRCVAIKETWVTQDERDTGPRRLLNFGHTLGHCLEPGSPLLHGEGVGLGMLFAMTLSERRLGLDPAVQQRLRGLLLHLGLPTLLPPLPWQTVQQRLVQDKKVRGGRSGWILLEALGRPVPWELDLADVEVVYHEVTSGSTP